jgi:hypothetical protein
MNKTNEELDEWTDNDLDEEDIEWKLLTIYYYCLTLTIRYSKAALQKLSNLYYNCLYKLFKFQLNNMEFKWINDFLKKYNLLSFQHRVFYRLSIFSFNCKNNIKLLILLKQT